jgi:hypothetical protein
MHLSSPHTYYTSHPSHSSRYDHPNIMWRRVQIIKFLIMYFLHSPVISSHLGPNILRTPFSSALSLRSSFNVSDQVSHPYKTTNKIIVTYVLITVICRVTLCRKRQAKKYSKNCKPKRKLFDRRTLMCLAEAGIMCVDTSGFAWLKTSATDGLF